MNMNIMLVFLIILIINLFLPKMHFKLQFGNTELDPSYANPPQIFSNELTLKSHGHQSFHLDCNMIANALSLAQNQSLYPINTVDKSVVRAIMGNILTDTLKEFEYHWLVLGGGGKLFTLKFNKTISSST